MIKFEQAVGRDKFCDPDDLVMPDALAMRDRRHLIAMVRALSGEITRIVEEGVPVKTFYDPLSQADVVAWADREASDGA